MADESDVGSEKQAVGAVGGKVLRVESLGEAADELTRVVGVLSEYETRMTGVEVRLKAAEAELGRLKSGAWRLVGAGAAAGLLLGSCAVDQHYSEKLDRAQSIARFSEARSRDAEDRERGSNGFARDADDLASWAEDDAYAARAHAREADARAQHAIEVCERMARDHDEPTWRCS